MRPHSKRGRQGLEAKVIRVATRSRPWAVRICGITCLLLRAASHLHLGGADNRYGIRRVTVMPTFVGFALIRIDART